MLRERVATTTARAQARLDAARRRSRAVDSVVVAYEHDRRAAGHVLAGAVAFRLFIYLLPLALGIVTLIGVLRGLDSSSLHSLGDQLGMSSYAVDSVESAAKQSQRNLWVLIPLAVWAIYSGGLGAAKVLRAVHAVAWGQAIERLRRGPASTAVAFGAALAAMVFVGGLQALRARSSGLGLGVALAEIVPFAALWLGISWLLPHDPRAPWTALLPGALLVGFALWLAQLASFYYLAHRVHHASELYGSLGVAATILAWLYLIGRLLVASAMLNATLWRRRSVEAGSADEHQE